MWKLDCEESWAPKNWCFWTGMLEKTLESPLDSKEIQPVHPKGDQSWVFIGKTDAEAETPILWPPHAKSWLIGKDWFWEGLGAGGEVNDRGWDGWMASPTQWTWVWASSRRWWRTGEPGMLQSRGCKELDTTERLNNNFISKHHVQIFQINLGRIPEKSGKRERDFPFALEVWEIFCKPLRDESTWGNTKHWLEAQMQWASLSSMFFNVIKRKMSPSSNLS